MEKLNENDKIFKQEHKIASIDYEVSDETGNAILKLCKNNDLSLYVYFLNCFTGLIYSYTGSSSMHILMPDINGKTGCAELSILINPENSLKQNLLDVAASVSRIMENEDVYDEYTIAEDKRFLMSSMQLHGIVAEHIKEKCDTWQFMIDHDNKLKIYLYYNTLLYTKDFAIKLLKDFLDVVNWSVGNMNTKFDDLKKTINPTDEIKNSIQKKIDNFPNCNVSGQTGFKLNQDTMTVIKEILKVDDISSEDNFFNLGGDSLKAILISSRLLKMNYSIDVNVMFSNPLIKEICENVRHIEADENYEEIIGEAPLTPIQHHFIDYIKTNFQYYNQTVMLYNKNGWNERVLRKTLSDIIIHHDALRCVLADHDDKKYLRYRSFSEDLINLSVFNLNGMTIHERQDFIRMKNQERQQSLDIYHDSMMFNILYHTDLGDHLFFAAHHMVVDGISWRILLEDFNTTYNQNLNENPVTLPRKTTSFLDWAYALKDYASSDKLAVEMPYWEKVGKIVQQPVFKDIEQKVLRLKDIYRATLNFSYEQTDKLIKGAKNIRKSTLLPFLLTALSYAIHQITGSNTFSIALEGHGRLSINNMDISRTVGCFSSVYPFTLNYLESLGDMLDYTQKAIENVPNQGIGYGINRYLRKKLKSEKSLPQIFFNYLGEFFNTSRLNDVCLSTYETGDSISQECEREYMLDIKGQILENRLQFTFDYSKEQLRTYDMDAFVVAFEEAIMQLINYCDKAVRVGDHILNQTQLSNVLSHLKQLEE